MSTDCRIMMFKEEGTLQKVYGKKKKLSRHELPT